MTDAQRAALSLDDPEYHWRCVNLDKETDDNLTRVQGNRLENPSRWVDYIFGVDVGAQVVHAGILPSAYSKAFNVSI